MPHLGRAEQCKAVRVDPSACELFGKAVSHRGEHLTAGAYDRRGVDRLIRPDGRQRLHLLSVGHPCSGLCERLCVRCDGRLCDKFR